MKRTFDFSSKLENNLKEIQDLTGIAKIVEIIRMALALYLLVAKHVSENWTLILVSLDTGNEKELENTSPNHKIMGEQRKRLQTPQQELAFLEKRRERIEFEIRTKRAQIEMVDNNLF